MNIDQQKKLLAEMKLMMHLGRHVNVLSLLGVITSQMSSGMLCAILEYCEMGSLRDYLIQYHPKNVQPVCLELYELQIVTGVTQSNF